MKDDLLSRLRKRQATVGVIGLGQVGLPLLLAFGEAGFSVVGFDKEESKIETLERGGSYLMHVPETRVSALRRLRRSRYTTDYSLASTCNALIICVPTPLDADRVPDISFIVGAMEEILPYLVEGQILSLESTTYPGTTEEQLRPRIESRGFTLGENYFLAFSPERENPGDTQIGRADIPKIVSGVTASCLEVGAELYGTIVARTVTVSSPRVAEMSKLMENTYRAVNIALANEMKLIAEQMDIDIWEVIDASSTKPFGFSPFYPGPGCGGHCIPIDPLYLAWKAREHGFQSRFIELADDINRTMPGHVLARTTSALGERGVALSKATLLILGVGYKKNVDDFRESPALRLIELFRAGGAHVIYHDPFIPALPLPAPGLNSSDLQSALGKADCAVLVADHDQFNYEEIRRHARLIVDTRGRYRGHFPNVIRA